MTSRIPAGFLALLVMVLAPVGASSGETVRLTIDEAVSLALKQSPRMRAADLDIDAAEAGRKAVRARFGPVLQFEGRAMYFNEPPSIGGGAMSEEDMAALQALAGADPFDNAMIQFFQSLPDMFESEQYDVTLTARIIQPLTPLYAVYHGYRLADLGVDAAGVARVRQRDELAFKVRESCLRLLQAKAGLRALEETVKTVDAHVEKARSFMEVGLIGRNDFLQAEVRLAEVRGQLLKVEHGVSLAKAALSMLLNLHAGSEVEMGTPEVKVGKGRSLKLEAAQAVTVTKRSELRELELRILQAEHGVKATRSGYLPQVSAMGMYQHTEGSIMKPPAWTVGVVVSWPLWEWGATYYSVEEAQAKLARAQAGFEELERAIKLDVRSSWLSAREARERIVITRSGLTHAEEQLRLEQERYDQHVNTSTEVLDAQTRLTRAKVESENAHYDYLVALAALKMAMGYGVKEELK